MSLARDAAADAGHTGEEYVREWGHDAADDEGRDQAFESAPNQAHAVVIDILHSCKPESDHARVDDTVDDAVEILAKEQSDQENAEPLTPLFDDGSGDDAGHRIPDKKMGEIIDD